MMVMNWVSWILSAWLFTQASMLAVLQPIKAKVIGVKDGDTIELLWNGKSMVVRLSHIDCPELKGGQPFGSAAKKYTSDLCFGKLVTLQNADKKDRNGRVLAEVITEKGASVNQSLVKAGMAWHFKKYSTDRLYAALEIEARQAKRGLWSDPHPIAPWDWRRNRGKGSNPK